MILQRSVKKGKKNTDRDLCFVCIFNAYYWTKNKDVYYIKYYLLITIILCDRFILHCYKIISSSAAADLWIGENWNNRVGDNMGYIYISSSKLSL